MGALNASAAIGAALICAAVAWADLPTWKLAEIQGLSSRQWGAVVEEPGGSYRAARAGQTASIIVPAWWGASFRPPEGTVYVLTIEYQDSSPQPVIFYAHAGVGPYWGLSEVHRFGGDPAGQGPQWKTAEVPLSWDLICLKAGAGGQRALTELAIRARADLPVRSIRLRLAGPEDAERYFRETRSWIARLQAGKRAAARGGPAEKAIIPDAMKGKPIVPYVRSWMRPVLPHSAPQEAEAGAAVRIRMARNEYDPAAFAVYANGRPLRNVTCAIGPLAGPAGQLNCELDLRTAEYSAVQETADYAATKDSGKYRLYPQRLWPAYAADVPAGQSQLFWLTIRTLGEASRPGRYGGTVRISAEGAAVELPVQVEVLPVTLPSVTEANLALSNCTAGLPTLQEVQTLVAHNHNGVDIWFGGTQPGMKVKDGKLELDWTYLDDWMTRAAKAGMTHVVWFFGGDPKGFPDTLNLERDLYRSRPGDGGDLRREFLTKANAAPEKVLPELRELYVDFVRQTVQHARAAGWPELILQPFDEPGKWAGRQRADNSFHEVVGAGPWIKDHFKDCCALIRQADPKVKLALEAHVVPPCLDFLGDVDIFCTNRAWQVGDLAERLRAAKVSFWQYANCDDQAPPHRTRYSFGFYFGAYGSSGSLVWAYNFMPRFDTSSGVAWGSGWYTPFGTVIAPSLVGLREGMDDRRWMEALRRAGGQAVLEELAKQALASRAETPYTSYNEVDDPAKLDGWRNRIMDAVLAQAKAPPER